MASLVAFPYECDGSEFCCSLGGTICSFSVEDEAGRAFACGLMTKYGEWDTVIASPEYQPIGEYWARNGTLPFNYCQSFDPAFCCKPEHRNGRRSEF